MTKEKNSWDDESNEAQNNFVSWGKVDDFVFGTLIGIREVESTLPDKKGEKQLIYDVKVEECKYHQLDDKKNPIEPAEEPQAGEMVSVGGRKTIDSRMARVKLGQKFGLKFTEEIPAKTKGYNATKLIKVFTPKDAQGNYWMDEEWVANQNDGDDVKDW